MPLRSWKEIAELTYSEPPFLIDPYIPRGGIVLLWADTSVGKSPLTWEMARAVGGMPNFFGLPVTNGRVLYIEIDTPEQATATRLKKLPVGENVWFLFMEPLSLPILSEEQMDALRTARDEVKPDLVVVNTLRNCHDMDDRESRVPKIIYTFFRTTFKGSAILFTHHNRKTPLDPRMTEIEKEKFSGSKAFVNDAQVGLHLGVFKRRDGKENLRLYHVKSQVSEFLKPLPLKLWGDGSTISSPLYEELLDAYMAMHDERAGMDKGKVDKLFSEKHLVSLSTARARRNLVETGKFPGSRDWLAPEPGEEDGDE